MSASAVRLSARGISHAFHTLPVLEAVDLEAAPGEVTVVIGPSGCGKSTLLGILGGLLAPAKGTVQLSGTVGPECLNPLTYVFQDASLLPWRSVAGNVSLVLEDSPLTAAERAERVTEVLLQTKLAEFAAAWPKQLSGGMRQRVGIARALAVRPAVLLMDEPLSALDAQSRALLLDDFAALIARAFVTCVYVTHNLAEAALLGQTIVVLSRRPGRVRAVRRIEQPVEGRHPEDPRLLGVQAELWELIRDDAKEAEREIASAEA
jgi:NitT/TauT family transport system ATP-binding protein